MKAFQQLFHHLILLPNVPFMVIVAVNITYQLYKENGFISIDMIENEEMKKHLKRIYPRHFKYFVAFVFYVSLLFHLS